MLDFYKTASGIVLTRQKIGSFRDKKIKICNFDFFIPEENFALSFVKQIPILFKKIQDFVEDVFL